MQRRNGLTTALLFCLSGAACGSPTGTPTSAVDDQLNVAPATLQEAADEMTRGNQLLANGADRTHVMAQLTQIRDRMDRLNGLVDQVTLAPNHVVSFYRTGTHTILVAERAPEGTTRALSALDLSSLSVAELHLKLAPAIPVPQSLLDSPAATKMSVSGDPAGTSAPNALGGGAPAEPSGGKPVTVNSGEEVVQSALTGADGAYFRNTYCLQSISGARTVFPFCLPNWSGGASAQASATHSHVTIAPFAGGGTVLLSPTVDGTKLATFAGFDGEVLTYYAISASFEVNNSGCCFICACGQHLETSTALHRWDVSAAGQAFHFGGIFVSATRILYFL